MPQWTTEEKERLADALQFVTEKCRRCGGQMRRGKAIAQTFDGVPDFPGGEVVTISPSGPGRLIDCLKCSTCGHSVTANAGDHRSAACGASGGAEC